jgi:hypothetical protein
LPIKFYPETGSHHSSKVETHALLDSGAGGVFIDRDYQQNLGIPTHRLERPIIVHNVDGTLNKKGFITEYVKLNLNVNGRTGPMIAHVTGLGKQNVILGYPWLQDWNPDVNWKMGSLKWRDTVGGTVKTPVEEPKSLEYRARKLEGQEDAENSGGRPNIFREPAIMALTFPNEEDERVEGTSPNEEGGDDLNESPVELGYPLQLCDQGETQEGPDHEIIVQTLILEDNCIEFDYEDYYWTIHAIDEKNISPKDFETLIHQLIVQEEFYPEDLWIQAKTNAAQVFAQRYAEQEGIKKPLEEQIPKEFHEYLSVFSKKAALRKPERKPWDHRIELKPGFVPKAQKAYSLSQDEVLLAEEFIAENLKKGYIRYSKSPQSSPLFFVNKKSGDKRPCQDYRYLNEWTIKNAYPLPLIQDLIDGLQGMKYFTKLDIRWGYNNIRIHEGDEWKAAFRTPQGLFEPTVMFFGLCNSPATFQSIMDRIFSNEALLGWLKKYMDDILIAAKTKEELRERTLIVLKKLKENDLFLKPEKCEFEQTKVEYLGFIISEGKVQMDPKKVAGIADWPVPTTLRQLRSFLGFGNYYRRFIRHYSNVTKPLNELLRKDTNFEWTEERDKVFNDLKKRFISQPILIIPDQTKPFFVESDASKYATGAVLMQKDSNGDLHPCSFISQTFSPAERNYQIYDRELLGIIRAIQEWRHYLLGSTHQTTVFTDHQNLQYYRSAQKLNRRQARWSLILSEYDIKLIHQPGTKMIQSDALSRRPDHIPEGDDDNEDIIMLPDALFVKSINTDPDTFPILETLINLVDTALMYHLNDDERDDWDQDLADLFNRLVDGSATDNEYADFSFETDASSKPKHLFYQKRLYIPNKDGLRRNIVQKHHDAPTAGHPGQLGTYHAISRYYWWPGLRSFVNAYVQGCAECQKFKIDRRPTKPALQGIESSKNTRPFAQPSMDLITGLPPSDGFNAILVVVDHGLTKGVILAPTMDTVDSEGIAFLLQSHLFKRFGLPDKLISDRDPRFASKAFQELLKLLGIQSAMSTAYHPQTDGATERANQEIEAYLAIYCAQFPEDWPQALSTLEFTYNCRRHADNKRLPFEMIMGLQPLATPTVLEETNLPSVMERFKLMQQYRDEALSAHEIARNRINQRIKANYIPFKLGQKVLLDTWNLKMKINSKLKPRREGPFKIEQVIGKVNYKLTLPQHWKVHPVFHAILLKPYKETEQHGPNFIGPPPDIVNDEEQYKVERIINHRKRGRTFQYLVRWKGYTAMDDSWEPETNLANAPDILKQYQDSQIQGRVTRKRTRRL